MEQKDHKGEKKCSKNGQEPTKYISSMQHNWLCPFACMYRSQPAWDDPEHLAACCRALHLCTGNNTAYITSTLFWIN